MEATYFKRMRRRSTQEVIKSLEEFKAKGLTSVGLSDLQDHHKKELKTKGYTVVEWYGSITVVSW